MPLLEKAVQENNNYRNMLLHLYQAESGNILINDNNIEDIQIETLRDKIAYSTTGIILFSGSIFENPYTGTG